jgi:hypothetical protein
MSGMTDIDGIMVAVDEMIGIAERIVSFVDNGGHQSERGRIKLDSMCGELDLAVVNVRRVEQDINDFAAGEDL